MISRPATKAQQVAAAWAVLCILGLVGCSGTNTVGESGPPQAPPQASKTVTVTVVDVLHQPVVGATVTMTAGSFQQSRVTSGDGSATFADVPNEPYTLNVVADGFEPLSLDRLTSSSVGLSLTRTGAWAIGPAIILGTRMVDRSTSGDSLVFSVDVAVIAGKDPEPLQTLTASDFALTLFDCGWGGPRDCASDANGHAALGHGHFSIDGPARTFTLQPGSVRHPYLAGIVAERSGDGSEWGTKAPALKSFFAEPRAADVVGLASVQVEQGASTFTAIGQFTSDGVTYLDAIDGLAKPAGEQPSVAQALPDAVRWTAAAGDLSGRAATLLWLSRGTSMSLEERDEAVALMQQSGLRVSAITGHGTDWDLGELALRTGGFVSRVDDMRQYGSVFGVVDQVLAGTLPYYRIEYRLAGEPGLFSPGGNVRVFMRIDVPASFGTQPVYTSFDVAIPF